jgi:polynucleotide 5'-kinase involved in rRNA processing
LENILNFFSSHGDARNINEKHCKLATNKPKWEYSDNDETLENMFEEIKSNYDTINFLKGSVPMIAIIGSSGIGKTFCLDAFAEKFHMKIIEDTIYICLNISFNGFTEVSESKYSSREMTKEAVLRLLFYA